MAVALLTLALMVATEARLPIVWDEGFTLIRLARVRAWLNAVRDPPQFAAAWDASRFATAMKDRAHPPARAEIDTWEKLFSRQVIIWFWPFAREDPHGHPPFYLNRDRKGLLSLTVGGLSAAVTLYATTPPWWSAPIEGLVEFFRSNLTRGENSSLAIQFLGTVYWTPDGSLPWYNTLVWTVAATPIGFLAWSLAGLAYTTLHREDRLASLAVLHWLFLLVLRALPHVPGHHGVRQFLPAFGILALVAGMGVAARPGTWSKSLIVAALAEGAISIMIMLPVPLSYFSPAVGGLPGAARLGFEPTYYWDTLTPDVLGWVNDHTAPGRSILFCGTPFSYYYLKRSEQLRPDALPFEGPELWQWYLVQNQPGPLGDLELELISHHGRDRVILSKLGVPLVWAFERSEVLAMASKIGIGTRRPIKRRS